MSCIEVEIRRVSDKISSSAKMVGGVSAKTAMVPDGVSASVAPRPSFDVEFSFVRWSAKVLFGRVGPLSAWSSMVCAPGLGPEPVVPDEKYLEIEPKILWVYADLEAYNDVYSNVSWKVK